MELDIEGTQFVSNGKIAQDLLTRVAALNTIRSILNDDNLFGNHDYIDKYRVHRGLSILIELCGEHLATLTGLKISTQFDREKIKKYLHSVLVALTDEPRAIDLTALQKLSLFTKIELGEIARLRRMETDDDVDDLVLPEVATQSDWKMNEKRSE